MNIYPRMRLQPESSAETGGVITAVLGPTNTGKTHLAVERMLGHASGMIGLPLRLLAREIYDRVVRLRGAASVALITGEEKILPSHPAYYVCTVESMPLDIETEFVAVDEIQLCTDSARGHIFTDRLLNARGRRETMFLGSEIMRPLIRQLLPRAQFISRPRFSSLAYAGSCKLSRMPRRSAIVAFSAEAVYGIAELIRRQRGGAAVVLGALSPRTRNAQVALYQSGEVDFLIATDAIGMGINMDVEHVAFAALSKFDGIGHRDLRPIEVSQIAGRAGRYLNNGTFGTTGDAGQMDEELIARVENHRFEPLARIKWRNSALDFGSFARLLASLEAPPLLPGLGRAREADDVIVLRRLAADSAIARISSTPASLKRMWNICQVPDFRQLGPDLHARLLGELFRYLMSSKGVLPEDYVARHVLRLDCIDGDIDALSTRIAHTRTWTFITNRNGWLGDTAYWRGRTREIEDRLSDALHERLIQRFIDRRTSVLMKRMNQKEQLMASLTPEGGVVVEGEFVGQLDGFRFAADASADGVHLRTIRNAATQALQGEIAARAFRLERHARIDDGKVIAIDEDGAIRWEGMAVARLVAGHDIMTPRVVLLNDPELLSGQPEIAVREALEAWLGRRIAKFFEPLIGLQASPDVEGVSKGLVFQLAEAMGVLPRARVTDLLKGIGQLERGKLRKLGVRFGERHIFMPAMLKPGVTAMKLRLWRAVHGLDQTLPVPGPGLSSVPAQADAPDGFYNIAGYEVCGPRAIRIDMLERLLVQLRHKNAAGAFPLTSELWSPAGCGVGDFEGVMRALGYAPLPQAESEAKQVEAAALNAEAVSTEAAGAEAASAEAAPEDLTMPDPEAEAGLPPEDDGRGGAPVEDLAAAEQAPCQPAIAPPPPVLWKFQHRREREHRPRNKIQHQIPAKKPRGPRSQTIKLAAPPESPAPLASDDAQAKQAPQQKRHTGRKRGNQAAPPRNTVSIKLADVPVNLAPGASSASVPANRARPGKPPARSKLDPPRLPVKPQEKVADPDSPFAKLQVLKERMQQSS